jgi:hypothetical protein
MNKTFLLLITLLLCISPVAAGLYVEPVGNFSQTFTREDFVVVNTTYINSQGLATPLPVAAGVAILGIILLILSIIYKPENGADIMSILSVPPLLISAWQFMSIDVVTAFGVTSQPMSSQIYKETLKFALMENHTIYSLYPVSILLVILLVIAILNVYRVLMITRLEMKGPDRLGGNSGGYSGGNRDDEE